MTDTAYTITELTRKIKRNLEEDPDLSSIWIIGEISNLTYHSSGHIYFTLKDESSVLGSVFFKYLNKKLSFRLEEGMSVFAFGGINVFEKRGSYQFIVSEVRLEGIGELQKRIEQLKKKLLAEGIFDQKRKRKLPFLPRRIGIATSPTGAALKDIIKVARRRFPNIEIVVSPANVQGSDAAESIVRAIETLNLPELRIDVIIAGRGGGSFEDLMPFSEEMVVRAIGASRVPIVSAVGHQVDHPLSDDAADAFAPTPSAAAEICVPVKTDLVDYIEYLTGRSNSALIAKTREISSIIKGVLTRRVFREPREIIYSREMLLGDLEKKLISRMKMIIVENRSRLKSIPELSRVMGAFLKDKGYRYSLALHALEKLSPLSIMNRGYSIVKSADKIVKRCDDVTVGQDVYILVSDGTLNCSVNSKSKGEKRGKE